MNLMKFKQDILNNGGATISLQTTEYNPTDGYIVGIYGTEEKTDQKIFVSGHVREFIAEHYDQLHQKGNYLGGWLSKGYVYLDVSKKFRVLSEAAVFSEENKQEALWGASEGKEIYVFGSQAEFPVPPSEKKKNALFYAQDTDTLYEWDETAQEYIIYSQ